MDKTRDAQVRARIKWIEKNIYLCNLEKARSKKRVITRFRKESGEISTEEKEIVREQVSYHTKL